MVILNGYNQPMVLVKIDIGMHYFVCELIAIYGHHCKWLSFPKYQVKLFFNHVDTTSSETIKHVHGWYFFHFWLNGAVKALS